MISSSERIFKDVVERTRLGQDKELVHLLKQNQNAKSPLHEEVEKLIRDLNLMEYKVAQQVGQEVADNDGETEATSKEQRPPAIQADERTQRRLSYEIKNLTQGEPSNRGTPSTPAIAAVSNFRVNSRVTNLENHDYTPVPYERPRKGSIKQTLRKYKARLQNSELNEVQQRTASSQTVMAARRSSLVGEVLPDYIRKQLTIDNQQSETPEHEHEQNKTTEAPENQSTSDTSLRRSRSTKSKNTSSPSGEDQQNRSENLQSSSIRRSLENSQSNRFNNVLMNSSSLYVRKGDNSSNVSQDGLDSGLSEADKEYISPSSFTRSIEDINDHDVLLYNRTDEDDGDDDDDEDEDNDDEDDGDYLFKN
ncbi:hypothetical protein FT663_05105 [Candidozyma haemuli var. vulneris]|uniref:Uncharacterized protein n=1 Tax=Candidozyma haemuli TaxID=45357 RepID=A0A2V1AUS4_9ASCO|nr:hypothetical protein CXQ85_002421 [[Candida] haemuloni]KAF3985405.1 hypothetical protein FT662_05168 [[Candida] haemuloni var. vulneris]KAF3985920.1 hypothetical protein FT663_05105 [[Candida] haemuloni var. vulneris]PVH20621.1 hypothetical protein CXQ85_002421 [[Candida] haemuloni]